MFVTRVAPLAGRVLILILITVGFAAASPRNASPSKVLARGSVPMVAEPAFAAEYLAAYARGDEMAADEIASPLYRMEWARRGLSPSDRQAIRPALRPSGSSAGWLHFDYVGGAVDWHGFGHLLYLARPLDPSQPTSACAWRLDTDPSGRVIWAELVFLFSDGVTAVSPVVGDEATSLIPMSSPLGRSQPRPVAGIQARDSREGYYAVEMPLRGPDARSASTDTSIAFFAVDADGQVRPGAWTYGEAGTGPSEYGKTQHPPVVTMEPEVARLEQSYLQALW